MRASSFILLTNIAVCIAMLSNSSEASGVRIKYCRSWCVKEVFKFCRTGSQNCKRQFRRYRGRRILAWSRRMKERTPCVKRCTLISPTPTPTPSVSTSPSSSVKPTPSPSNTVARRLFKMFVVYSGDLNPFESPNVVYLHRTGVREGDTVKIRSIRVTGGTMLRLREISEFLTLYSGRRCTAVPAPLQPLASLTVPFEVVLVSGKPAIILSVTAKNLNGNSCPQVKYSFQVVPVRSITGSASKI